MDFNFTDEQNILRETVRKFMEKNVLPFQAEDEKNEHYRPEITRKMAELGFFGCGIPEELGGNGMGYIEAAIIAEEIARVSGSYRVITNMQNIGSSLTIKKFGTEEQKKLIPKWVTATALGYFAITEPNVGSDVASMGTTAIDKGDYWELNGSKNWISHSTVADWGMIYAATDRSQKSKGVSCFLVNLKETTGITVRAMEGPMGLHCMPIGEIYLEGVKVPKENVVGKVGDGFKICMWMLNNTRLACAAGALGLDGAAVDACIKYSNERVQFGQKIGQYQMIQAQIAEMEAEHQAARLLVYQAAWLKDQGMPSQQQTCIAKMFASEAAVRAANEAVKILGAYGYSREYPVERILRDAKASQIVEGSTNIQKMLISRIALGYAENRV